MEHNTVLTLEQAAQYLQLSPEDVQTELEAGRIPGRKFGGKWRVHRQALDALLGVSTTSQPVPESAPVEGNGNQPVLAPADGNGGQPVPAPADGNGSEPVPAPDEGNESGKVPEPADAHSFFEQLQALPEKPIPAEGTYEAQSLSQKAIKAKTEGRLHDARKLFEQAIKAGGGVQVYPPFVKMEIGSGRNTEAKQLIQQAIKQFPDQTVFYNIYGQMERRSGNYTEAETIFRAGLKFSPSNAHLRRSLAQTLVQIGTEDSLQKAGEIYEWLDRRGKLHKKDGLYQRYITFKSSPRANKAYDFFRRARMEVGIATRRDLPQDITDMVFEASSPELSESFNLTGHFLVRCLQRRTESIDIINLQEYLRKLSTQGGILVLQEEEGQVVVNTSLAFIATPDNTAVRNQVYNILSRDEEAIIPLDDKMLQNSGDPLNTLRDVLGRYLGRRNLYDSTFPVSGRRFFGRDNLLPHLTDLVKHGQFLGIFGLRKMGKTSLAYQLRDEKLRGEAVAYVDLQASSTLSSKDCTPLYWELERSLYTRLQKQQQDGTNLLRLGRVAHYTDLPNTGNPIALLFNEDMRLFLDALSRNALGRINRLVIVLDELERILPVAGQQSAEGYLEFFGLLRGLAQQYPGLLSCIVIAANAAISEHGYWKGRENPVFALFKPIFLPPLLQKECDEMVVKLGKGMSVYWEPDALQAVFDETGGHPFLTRSFCSHIAQSYSARPLTVTSAMVQEQVHPYILHYDDKLQQITQLLSATFPEEERILEQIALGEAPGDIPNESLRHLIGYSLVKRENGEYQITLNLLRRWLRERAGVEE